MAAWTVGNETPASFPALSGLPPIVEVRLEPGLEELKGVPPQQLMTQRKQWGHEEVPGTNFVSYELNYEFPGEPTIDNCCLKSRTSYQFQDQAYLWPNGLTRTMLAPQLEYMGPPAEASKATHQAFQESLGPIMKEINQKKRKNEGLLEVFENFQKYCSRLAASYSSVGYVGRDERFANLHLMINLAKQKFSEEFAQILNLSSVGGSTTNIMRVFLTVEPWDTRIESLKKARMTITSTTTEAAVGTFVTSVNNGDIDTPSFHVIIDGGYESGGIRRLGKWIATGGGAQIYELKITFTNQLRFRFDGQTWDQWYEETMSFVKSFCESLCEIEVELFSLFGTINIQKDRYMGHTKVANLILSSMAQSKNLQVLERLQIVDCWVDFDTITHVNQVVAQSQCNAIRLKSLRLGLLPPDPPAQVWLTQGEMEFGCTGCCCCVTDFLEYEEAKMDFEKQFVPYAAKYQHLLAGQEGCAQDFVGIAANMCDGGIIDFTGTRLIEFCGKAERVNEVLSGLAKQKPLAVTLLQTGLTDANVHGICQMLFANPKLLHLDVGICSSTSEGMENIQNLAQTSPLLVSGSLVLDEPLKVQVAGQPYLKQLKNYHGEFCCDPSVEVWAMKQDLPTFQFPEIPLPDSEFNIYKRTIQNEIQEHAIVPMYLALAGLWRGDEKKIKRLVRAARDDFYKPVLSLEADKPKIGLFQRFLATVHSKAKLEELFEAELELEMEALGQLGKTTFFAITNSDSGPTTNLAIDYAVKDKGLAITDAVKDKGLAITDTVKDKGPTLEERMEDMEAEIERLTAENASKSSKTQELGVRIAHLTEDNSLKARELDAKGVTIAHLTQENSLKARELDAKERMLEASLQEVRQLQNRLQAFQQQVMVPDVRPVENVVTLRELGIKKEAPKVILAPSTPIQTLDVVQPPPTVAVQQAMTTVAVQPAATVGVQPAFSTVALQPATATVAVQPQPAAATLAIQPATVAVQPAAVALQPAAGMIPYGLG